METKIKTYKINDIFENESFKIIEYALYIIDIFEYEKDIDENDEKEFDSDSFFKNANIYKLIANRELTKEGFLSIFATHFDQFFSKIAYFVSKEKYEIAELLKKALNYEVEFTIKYILHNFNIREEIELLKKRFSDFYLD